MSVASLFRRLRRALAWCAHTNRYIERREHDGVPAVPHYVCEACGDGVPVMSRSASEHLQMRRVGAVRTPKAKKARASVVSIQQRRGA